MNAIKCHLIAYSFDSLLLLHATSLHQSHNQVGMNRPCSILRPITRFMVFLARSSVHL